MRWPDHGLPGWALLGLLWSVPSFCFSQSFDPAKTYQVPGSTLNRLENDLKTAQGELLNSKALNEQLQAGNAQLLTMTASLSEQLAKESSARQEDSKRKQEALTALQTQLQTASESLKKYERQTLIAEIGIGAVAFLLGFIVSILMRG